VAMLATLLSYDGWSNISYVAGEIREPRRNLPLAMGIGLAIAVAVYLLANLAYLRVLPISEIAASQRVGAAVAERTLGTAGGAIVSLTILLSILGAANGHILTTPRLLFAMSRDGLIFERLGQIHPRFQTMSFNIAMQGLWAAVLVVTGSFETLVTYAMFAAFIFYGLTVAWRDHSAPQISGSRAPLSHVGISRNPDIVHGDCCMVCAQYVDHNARSGARGNPDYLDRDTGVLYVAVSD